MHTGLERTGPWWSPPTAMNITAAPAGPSGSGKRLPRSWPARTGGPFKRRSDPKLSGRPRRPPEPTPNRRRGRGTATTVRSPRRDECSTQPVDRGGPGRISDNRLVSITGNRTGKLVVAWISIWYVEAELHSRRIEYTGFLRRRSCRFTPGRD